MPLIKASLLPFPVLPMEPLMAWKELCVTESQNRPLGRHKTDDFGLRPRKDSLLSTLISKSTRHLRRFTLNSYWLTKNRPANQKLAGLSAVFQRHRGNRSFSLRVVANWSFSSRRWILKSRKKITSY